MGLTGAQNCDAVCLQWVDFGLLLTLYVYVCYAIENFNTCQQSPEKCLRLLMLE